MSNGALSLDALRVLRPIVFAGALDGPESLVTCNRAGLEDHLTALRRGGYIEDIDLLVPTDAGLAEIERWYASDRAGLGQEERDAIVSRFRPLDLEAKRLSIAWQDAEDRDNWDARMSVIEALADLQQNTLAFVAAHRTRVPRWVEFGDRLQTALDAVLDGQTDYVVSVRLPSYHTVWFEFHEDLLRTLERQREAE